MISHLHDNLGEIMTNKYLKYIGYVVYKLRILKNMRLVLDKRLDILILSKIIELNFNNIKGKDSFFNRYSFQINIIYHRLSPDFSDEIRKVIDFNMVLKLSKIVAEIKFIENKKRTVL